MLGLTGYEDGSTRAMSSLVTDEALEFMSFGRRVSKVVLYADLRDAGLDGGWRAGKRRSSSGDGGVGGIASDCRCSVEG